ncbi:MAG: AAA family ATPase [Candidatus Bathyarchaeota archaeon]|nr:MAG: AAA family ATPase [Candidatus Bathyarchaeota archaeon]
MRRWMMEFDLESHRPIPVRYELRYVMLRKLMEGEDPLPDIQGRKETKRDVIRAVLSNTHPYLISREGTGKTRLAESLAKLLPPVPKIKGCPYNCDPKWPEEWMCPSCRHEEDPEIELISGKQRYSRIQGNEYTHEAKLLGVKDIQAIVQGGSPTDPRAFIGTGVLRGNRGVVCVDELPAIPTKVQVLFHPMLQESKIILEEYAWERPIDLFFIATGNPTGFAHVNRIPEPLLDRLELIPMGLPDEPVEREIMFRERFRVYDEFFQEREEAAAAEPLYVTPASLKRSVTAPWWIVETIVKTARYTRDCPNIDRGASIRGSIKALDHTHSTTEMRGGRVSNLGDAIQGLQLALRGRVRLRADLIGFDEREGELMSQTARVVEDVMWYAVRDVGNRVLAGFEGDRRALPGEVEGLIAARGRITESLGEFPAVTEALALMDEIGPADSGHLVDGLEDQLRSRVDGADPEVVEEYRFSALELLANALMATGAASYPDQSLIFVPRRMET